VEFIDETIYQNCQNFAPPVQCTDDPIKCKEFRSQLFLGFLLIISQTKRFWPPYVLRLLCLFLIIELTLKVCLWNSDTHFELLHFLNSFLTLKNGSMGLRIGTMRQIFKNYSLFKKNAKNGNPHSALQNKIFVLKLHSMCRC
jgi:hypothetical protein